MCRRFLQLVNSPQLLHSVSVIFTDQQWVPPLRSLCHWLLLRAGGAVRQLHLATDHGIPAGQESGEAEALLISSVMACAVGGGLEELDLESLAPATISSWVVALRSLRRLRLQLDAPVTISTSLAPLSTLEELDLHAHTLKLLPTAALPPSLTKLRLGPAEGWGEEAPLAPTNAMPNQVRCTGCQHMEGYAHCSAQPQPPTSAPAAFISGGETSAPAPLSDAPSPVPVCCR